MKKYEKLRNKYPEYISLDAMFRICHISKRSALYLIEHGIIPVEDNGKKTWRYRIALEDVINYLNSRDKYGSMIPHGAVSSRCNNYHSGSRVSFSCLITPGKEHDIAEYFEYIYADYPDVLNTTDIVEMTGFSKKTVLQLLKNGELTSIRCSNKYMIPKKYLLEFVCTPRFVDCKSNSEFFKKIIGGFKLWKTAKS